MDSLPPQHHRPYEEAPSGAEMTASAIAEDTRAKADDVLSLVRYATTFTEYKTLGIWVAALDTDKVVAFISQEKPLPMEVVEVLARDKRKEVRDALADVTDGHEIDRRVWLKRSHLNSRQIIEQGRATWRKLLMAALAEHRSISTNEHRALEDIARSITDHRTWEVASRFAYHDAELVTALLKNPIVTPQYVKQFSEAVIEAMKTSRNKRQFEEVIAGVVDYLYGFLQRGDALSGDGKADEDFYWFAKTVEMLREKAPFTQASLVLIDPLFRPATGGLSIRDYLSLSAGQRKRRNKEDILNGNRDARTAHEQALFHATKGCVPKRRRRTNSYHPQAGTDIKPEEKPPHVTQAPRGRGARRKKIEAIKKRAKKRPPSGANGSFMY